MCPDETWWICIFFSVYKMLNGLWAVENGWMEKCKNIFLKDMQFHVLDGAALLALISVSP